MRSQADSTAVLPKASQWWVLSRAHAQLLSANDGAELVDAACGGSWRGCLPSTSEELAMASIVGAIPAVAMGSGWLEEHPAPLDDPELEEARAAEAAAGPRFAGGPVHDSIALPGVNKGKLQLRDVGRTNDGDCLTWNWWDDFPSSAEREPAFGPQAAFAAALNATSADAVELLLEQHLDRAWLPLYHPQLLGRYSMTSAFLLRGLCAHGDTLFARKFDYDFSLRSAPFPREANGSWACAAASAWMEPAATESLAGKDCAGFRPAPILGLDTRECAALCCASNCTAWSWRGWRGRFEGCWLAPSAVSDCQAKFEAARWFGERLLSPNAETADSRASVVAAFRECYTV